LKTTRTSLEIELEKGKQKEQVSLRIWLLRKAQQWINQLLEAELTEFLNRKRYEAVDAKAPNYRNGYRPRKLNLLGLGEVRLRVPRDRRGEFKSVFLPERRGQDMEFESFIAECFLAGLSTRDIGRITRKHFGKRYDSKQVSRIVDRASQELEAWQQRSLQGRPFQFLFVDGANFRVRIGQRVSLQSFCAVLGISEPLQTYEVLGLTMGDREKAQLWANIFSDLARRGLDMEAVQLGIMDGLPGLEDVFRSYFPCAQTQRCQVHAKSNALRRVRKSDREAFNQDVNRVFYAPTRAAARSNFQSLKSIWEGRFPGAVQVIARDLESLLRFFDFDPTYWTTLRTTNPIERLNKEFKRRTRAMEVTGGEQSTYRILTYVAMNLEYSWSFHPITQWAHTYMDLVQLYTQKAA